MVEYLLCSLCDRKKRQTDDDQDQWSGICSTHTGPVVWHVIHAYYVPLGQFCSDVIYLHLCQRMLGMMDDGRVWGLLFFPEYFTQICLACVE